MRMIRTVAAFAALMTTTVACARSNSIPEPLNPVTLRVENQAFLDMNIYTVYHSQRIRVGTATGNRTTVFRVPVRIMGSESLQFYADPIGGTASPVSEEVLVSPGDVITLTIPPG